MALVPPYQWIAMKSTLGFAAMKVSCQLPTLSALPAVAGLLNRPDYGSTYATKDGQKESASLTVKFA